MQNGIIGVTPKEHEMNNVERTELTQLREEVSKDMKLAIANFKIWLLATVLINTVLIGVPALFVYFDTDRRSTDALTIAIRNETRLNSRSDFIDYSKLRFRSLENEAKRQNPDYEPVKDPEPSYD